MNIRFPMAAIVVAASLTACIPNVRVVGVAPVAREQLYTYQENEERGLICPVDTTGLSVGYGDLGADAIEAGYYSRDTPTDVRRRCRSDKNWEHHATLRFDLAEIAASENLDQLSRITVLSARAVVDPPQNCATDRRTDWAPELTGLLVITGEPRSHIRADLLPSVETGAPEWAREIRRTFEVDGVDRDWRLWIQDALRTDIVTDGGSTRPDGTFVLAPARVAEIRDALIAVRDGVTDDASVYVVFVGAKNPDITRDRACGARYENLRLALTFDGD